MGNRKVHSRFMEVVKFLHPEATILTCIVHDTGDGLELAEWSLSGDPPTDDEVTSALPSIDKMIVVNQRRLAYQNESDPLGMKAQRLAMQNDPAAEQAKTDYLNKVDEIVARYPYATNEG